MEPTTRLLRLFPDNLPNKPTHTQPFTYTKETQADVVKTLYDLSKHTEFVKKCQGIEQHIKDVCFKQTGIYVEYMHAESSENGLVYRLHDRHGKTLDVRRRKEVIDEPLLQVVKDHLNSALSKLQPSTRQPEQIRTSESRKIIRAARNRRPDRAHYVVKPMNLSFPMTGTGLRNALRNARNKLLLAKAEIGLVLREAVAGWDKRAKRSGISETTYATFEAFIVTTPWWIHAAIVGTAVALDVATTFGAVTIALGTTFGTLAVMNWVRRRELNATEMLDAHFDDQWDALRILKKQQAENGTYDIGGYTSVYDFIVNSRPRADEIALLKQKIEDLHKIIRSINGQLQFKNLENSNLRAHQSQTVEEAIVYIWTHLGLRETDFPKHTGTTTQNHLKLGSHGFLEVVALVEDLVKKNILADVTHVKDLDNVKMYVQRRLPEIREELKTTEIGSGEQASALFSNDLIHFTNNLNRLVTKSAGLHLNRHDRLKQSPMQSSSTPSTATVSRINSSSSSDAGSPRTSLANGSSQTGSPRSSTGRPTSRMASASPTHSPMPSSSTEVQPFLQSPSASDAGSPRTSQADGSSQSHTSSSRSSPRRPASAPGSHRSSDVPNTLRQARPLPVAWGSPTNQGKFMRKKHHIKLKETNKKYVVRTEARTQKKFIMRGRIKTYLQQIEGLYTRSQRD